MGTTRTALLNDTGVQLGFVVCIEGYDKLLTNAADVTKAQTAWSGTDWSTALPGLMVTGNFEQRFSPFQNDIQVPSLTLTVRPDAADTFATDIFKSKPDVNTKLTVAFPSSSTGFTMTVADTSNLAASGKVYIGTSAYTYSAKPTSTTLTISSGGEGELSPFAADGLSYQMPMSGKVPTADTQVNWSTQGKVTISDKKRYWVGSKVGLWCHRIVGGVWDTKAQAELLFAGIIDSITEAESGDAIVECSGIQSLIQDTVLMPNQWTAGILEGVTVPADCEFDMFLSIYHTTTDNAGYQKPSTNLKCVAGASGSDEFLPGRYTVNELCPIIENWLNSDATLGANQWAVGIFASEHGPRLRVECTPAAGTYFRVQLGCNDGQVFQFLGLEETGSHNGFHESISDFSESPVALVGNSAPWRTASSQTIGEWASKADPELTLSDPDGDFYDYTANLPPEAAQYVGSGETWSFFTLDDKRIFLARKDSDTQLSGIKFFDNMTDIDSAKWAKKIQEDEGLLNVKQVIIMSDNFKDLFTKCMASIDGNGENHATYDVLPFGAAVPWELLGNNWVNSLKSIEEGTAEKGVTLFLDRPTRLWDAFKSELVMRAAFVVWKDGGLQVQSLQTPNASNADWTLDETNKAVQAGSSARTVTQHTSEFLVNNVKVEYNRVLFSENYRDTIMIRDEPSINDFGISKPITIKARNSYDSKKATGASVEALVETFAARFIPPLARPLKRWRRSISHNLFLAVPGDTVAMSDDFVRSPTTGKRGVSSRAGTVLGVSWSLGVSSGGDQTYNGTMDILFTEEDRNFPLSPCCIKRDYTGGNFTNGWNATDTRLAVEDDVYQISGGTHDATHFAAGDVVRIVEVDPLAASSPDTFTDTIVAVDSSGTPNYIELTNGFGAGGRPAHSATKFYRVISDIYSNTVAAQKLESYQCANDDLLIEDTIEPNAWSEEHWPVAFAAADTTDPAPKTATNSYADGAPLHPGLLDDVIKTHNHLVNYGCLSQVGFLSDTETAVSIAYSGTYALIYLVPLFMGHGYPSHGGERKLIVAPCFRSGSGASVTCRITSSAQPPRNTINTAAAEWEDVTWKGPKQQVTFSTSSTTSWTIPTAQELLVVRDPNQPEITWLSIEATDNTGIVGLSECRWKAVW